MIYTQIHNTSEHGEYVCLCMNHTVPLHSHHLCAQKERHSCIHMPRDRTVISRESNPRSKSHLLSMRVEDAESAADNTTPESQLC